LRVLLREPLQFVADATRFVPRPEDVEARGLLCRSLLADALPSVIALDRDPDAGCGQLRALARCQHRIGPDAGRGPLGAGELEALRGLGDVFLTAFQRVHLEAQPTWLCGHRRGEQRHHRY
jgi:hypothetical protein